MNKPLPSASRDPICIALDALGLRVTALTDVEVSLSDVHASAAGDEGSRAGGLQQQPSAEARTRQLMRQIFGQIDDVEAPLCDAPPAAARHDG